ncbi:MAG: radical SAM protein [Bacteroidales bacterium]|nr:radical SAM protein [Bacteroidales bacterium]
MDKIKKILLFRIPMSICNLRCHYCYLGQRDSSFEGIQPEMKYTPEQVGYALRRERIGGTTYANFCADGETLLVKDIDKYVRAVVEQGHYAEVVTNLTVFSVLDKFLAWPKDLLERVEFKCSFHYLELKAKNKLALFAENVRKIIESGSSANVEITPSDELIPYIDEVKAFSMKHFGALPHLTIARDDRTSDIAYLTKLPIDEYDKVWGGFNSDFWSFKKTIFGKYQNGFCYAGKWSIYIDLCTGDATKCYSGGNLKNVFSNPDEPFPETAIGKCPIAHCYNGHALLSLGLIPKLNNVYYGNIRDRQVTGNVFRNRNTWLNPKLKAFFNTKLEESNPTLTPFEMVGHKISLVTDRVRGNAAGIKYRLKKLSGSK